MFEPRLDALRKSMAAKKLDAFLVTNINNVFYLSGFTGTTAVVIVTHDECCILVDPRYTIQAKAECSAAQVVEYTGRPVSAATAEQIARFAPKTLGYEAAHTTVSAFRRLRKAVDRSTSLRSTNELVEALRTIKDAHEIKSIRIAAKIADATFDSVIEEIRPGMTEREVAMLIDFTMRRLGADGSSFATIVAAGPNAAKPHAVPSDSVLQSGQMLKMDYGARCKRYCSDITRTVFLGKPTAKQEEVYHTVLEAQLAAIDAVRPGIAGAYVDSIAREVISAKGYGDCFQHGLGHMIGIEVHDGAAFSSMSGVTLQPGMTATVEPGIYIEGWGGVRIEDDVLVTDSGVEVITEAPKELLVI